jgi:hypothetical protein
MMMQSKQSWASIVANSSTTSSTKEFWYFLVEGTSNDNDLARAQRQVFTNQQCFKQHLKSKYGDGWLYACEFKEDDCRFLWNLRSEQMREEEDQYYRMLELQDQLDEDGKMRQELEDREEEDMRHKLATGEITRKQFRKWQQQKELDEMDEEEAYFKDCLKDYFKDKF